MSEITQTDLIYAFTGEPNDTTRTSDTAKLLERLEIGLNSLRQAQATQDKRSANNVLRGALIRFSQVYGNAEVAAKVDEIVRISSQITGL